ncbi:MAG: AAA family ATPase [Succinivibrio sp.]|nr:AAA family ATPase [Succinivibrio sp.]
MKKIALSEHIEIIYEDDSIYVDKTEYIYHLIKHHERVFYCRPRRFGKSLTLNIIGTLFEKGVDPYFKGTWIYDKWQEDRYPILRLSFLHFSITDVDKFRRYLCYDLARFGRMFGIEHLDEEQDPALCLRKLLSALPHGQQIVVLIDEYDCQLTANISKVDLYAQFIAVISDFYAEFTGNKHIRFLAVTGVTRLKSDFIFSEGTDIEDVSYDHAYARMIGFTRTEIKKYYPDYLKLAVGFEQHKEPAAVTDKETENLLDRMTEYYAGYCFDERCEQKVFSTWSVKEFLHGLEGNKSTEFESYHFWFESGGRPAILTNYVASPELKVQDLLASAVESSYDVFMNPPSLPFMDLNVLMCQTGYLTLKSEINMHGSIRLGPPNKEVSFGLARCLCSRFFTSQIDIFTHENFNLLENGNAGELIDLFNNLFALVDHDNYPIDSEAALKTLVQFYLLAWGTDVRTEQHNSKDKGRSDLIVNFQKRRMVIELKFSPDGKNSEVLLQEAINLIEDKEYGTENLLGRELLKIACVFDAAEDHRKITVFKTVV